MPSPKPRFFIIRPGVEKFTSMGELVVQASTIVPLVPIDLLPEWLEVDGVARALQPGDTADMINLGLYHAEANTYRLKFHRIDDDTRSRGETNGGTDESSIGSASSSSSHPSSPPTALASQAESESPATSKPAPTVSDKPPPPNDADAGLVVVVVDDRCSSSSSSPRPAAGPTCSLRSASPASRAPNPPKADADASAATKTVQACRYWCSTGTCKWGNICRYQHVMPTTAEGLASAGLDDYPAWWLATAGKLQVPVDEQAGEPVNKQAGKPANEPAKKSTKKKRRRKLRRLADKSRAGNDQAAAAARPSLPPGEDRGEGPEVAPGSGTEAETRSHSSTEDYLIEM